MFFILVLAFAALPLIEIFVLLQAGAAIGALPVIALCVLTAILGGAVIRLQGLAAIARARADLNEGRPPVAPAVDGALLAVAAPFLMTPGFVTDAIGFALLTPPLRRALARRALVWLKGRIAKGDARVTIIER